MEKALFSVSCTTCRARLAVRNKSAIGQILECPKCGSMVMISPPDGWIDEVSAPLAAATPPASITTTATPRTVDTTTKTVISTPPQDEAATEKPQVVPPPIQATVTAAIPSKTPAAALASTTLVASASVAAPPVVVADATPSAPPPTPPVSTEGPQAIAVRLGFTPFKVPEAVAGQTYLSVLTQSFLGRLLVLVVSGVLGLASVLGVWMLVFHRHPAATARTDDAAADSTPAGTSKESGTSPEQIDRRWLPRETVCVLDVRLSRLARQPEAINPLAFLAERWQPYANIQSLLFALNVRREQVRRLTWATTDLSDASRNCVLILEMESSVDPAQIVPKGEELRLDRGLVAHRLPSAGRANLIAILDGRKIVTGSEELLRQLAGRGGDAALGSAPMDLLVKKLVSVGELAVLIDLSAARSAGWKLPADWLDVWPQGKARWRLLCETPLALALSVQTGEAHRCELGLVCSGETMAEKLRLEMRKLVASAVQVLPDHIAGLKQIVRPEKVGAAAAEQYRQVLDDLLASLRGYGCETSDGILWLRLNWSDKGLPNWIATALDSEAAWKADRLAAARTADEATERGLLKALLEYVKKQDPPKFPAGAGSDTSMVRPDTRLSWIAELLPYLGRADWNLNHHYDYDSRENQAVTQRPLPEVVNPAFGPAVNSKGYPVTHYVGAAGVGEDAARLAANEPRAGVFGYERQTRQQDLVRGGANTIAILGVQDHCGPWAQGGHATVRSLTQQPYINGPDGFGSGQDNGMVVGMADGSVRFLSKEIEPEIMEKLVTVREGNNVDVASLEPRPRPELGPPPLVPPRNAVPKPPVAVVRPKPKVPLDPKLQVRLNEPIQKITLNNMPLADAVRLAASIGALTVSYDPDAMRELGVSLHDPIMLETTDTTVAKLLEKIAAARNMAIDIQHNQPVLTSQPDYREELRPIRYTVSDLTRGEAPAAAELARLLERFVVPESWQAAGGQGMIEVAPDALRITQTGHVHHEIIVFCEKFRVARGLPTRSRLDPKRFSLQTRTAEANAVLSHVTSINIGTATPLSEIIEQLKHPAGTEFLFDRPALAAAGVRENAPTKLRSENLPQGIVLRQLLDPLGLAWRAVDANTLQVTTKNALAARLEVEFYPVGKRLAGQPPAALIEKVRGVRGATWGEAGATGAVAFDPLSQTLIVLQTQPVQVAIEALLAPNAK